MNINNLKVEELSIFEVTNINGGGPIIDGLKWYYRTMGSFWHGVYDGFVGNEPAVAV